MNRPCRRAYDHRLRHLVCEERDPALFAQLGIPRSTAVSWIRRGSRSIVTLELFGQDEQALRARVLKLERRVRLLLGIVRHPVSVAARRTAQLLSPRGRVKSRGEFLDPTSWRTTPDGHLARDSRPMEGAASPRGKHVLERGSH